MTDSPAPPRDRARSDAAPRARQTPGGVPDGVELANGTSPARRPSSPERASTSSCRRTWARPTASARSTGVDVGLVQSQSIGYDDVPRCAAARTRLRERGERARDVDRRAHPRARARCAARHPRLRARREPRGVGRPRGTRASPTAACCSLGYGGVGRAIEDRLAPFEVELARVATRARDDAAGRIHGIDELPPLLPTAEIVIVGVPLNDATTGLVDAAIPRRRCPTARSSSTSRAARSPTPTPSSPRRRPADCASRSTSPTPSRCPRGIRSSPCRTC